MERNFFDETDKSPLYPRPSAKIIDATIRLIDSVINDTQVVYAEAPLDEPLELIRDIPTSIELGYN